MHCKCGCYECECIDMLDRTKTVQKEVTIRCLNCLYNVSLMHCHSVYAWDH